MYYYVAIQHFHCPACFKRAIQNFHVYNNDGPQTTLRIAVVRALKSEQCRI